MQTMLTVVTQNSRLPRKADSAEAATDQATLPMFCEPGTPAFPFFNFLRHCFANDHPYCVAPLILNSEATQARLPMTSNTSATRPFTGPIPKTLSGQAYPRAHTRQQRVDWRP